MRRYRHLVTYAVLTTLLLQTFSIPQTQADDFFGRYLRLWKETHYHGTPPVVCEDTAIEVLAQNIDWLEHHIDRYGSIVAKQPDIWGEARLTKHRDEYEKMLYQELNQFKTTINASIEQSDSSFLAQALALSAAVEEGSAPPATSIAVANATDTAPPQQTVTSGGTPPPASTATLVSAKDITASTSGIAGATSISLEPTINLDQISRYVQHLHELRRINEGDDTSDSPGYSLNLVRVPVSISPGKLTHQGFGAEITITATPYLSDDLLPNTFRNLAVNDLVDQLSLPLVKTVENKELINDQSTRKEAAKLAIKTINRLNSWNYLDTKPDREECQYIVRRLLENSTITETIYNIVENIATAPEYRDTQIGKSIDNPNLARDLEAHKLAIIEHNQSTGQSITVLTDPKYAADNLAEFVIRIVRFGIRDAKDRNKSDKVAAEEALVNAIISMSMLNEKSKLKQHRNLIASVNALQTDYFNEVFGEFSAALDEIPIAIASTPDWLAGSGVNSSGRARRAVEPLPPSQVIPVYGIELFYTLSDFFCPAYDGRNVRWSGKRYCESSHPTSDKAEHRVDLLDAQKWLRAEVAAAHELLCQPQHLQLWYQFAKPESGLAQAIRGGHLSGKPPRESAAIERMSYGEEVGPILMPMELPTPLDAAPTQPEVIMTPPGLEDVAGQIGTRSSVEAYRNHFFAHLHRHHFAEGSENSQVLKQLAWAIVVESALLNQHLNTDIRKQFIAKGEGCPISGEQDLCFFLPESATKPETGLAEQFALATKVFQDYVRCRWPIHVFALDPREQDQNVADASIRRRELQFAMSLAFVSGRMSARSLTQYSRELETEIQTIGLNRTASAFAHGHDTFGWRFYPRVQPLDVPGTFGTIWQSVAGTPRDADVRHRQLEPGMRECIAIVLMPSFVPYVDVDVRSNWFKLTNPKNAVFTMKDAILFSKAITSMRNSQAQCAECAHCYRPGEVHNLMARVQQLDRELPLQTMRQLVPYENTLGGFEMFNTGITDLAPELIGWYGAPGIVIDRDKPFVCGCASGCQFGTPCTTPNNCDQVKADLEALKGTVAAITADKVKTTVAPPICQGHGTTVFLVGDNLSVHDTKVIAGGVCIPHVQLVSRQIMRVTFPSCVNVVEVDGEKYVAIYAATPYGITNHLHIPIHSISKNTAIEDKVGELTKAVGVLQASYDKIISRSDLVIFESSLKKLEYEATCDAQRKLTFVPKNTKTPVTLTLTSDQGIAFPSTLKFAVKYKDQFRMETFDSGLSNVVIADGNVLQLKDAKLVDFLNNIKARLEVDETTVPSISLAEFKGKPINATLHGFYVTSDGREVPLQGVIPIEITLNCPDCVPQQAAAADNPTASVNQPASVTPGATPANAAGQNPAPLPPQSVSLSGCGCSAINPM